MSLYIVHSKVQRTPHALYINLINIMVVKKFIVFAIQSNKHHK